MKKKKIIAGGAVLGAVLLTFALLLLWKTKTQERPDKNMTEEEIQEHNKEAEEQLENMLENIQVKVEQSEDFVEPGKDALNVEKVQGFEPDEKAEQRKEDKKDNIEKGELLPAIDTGNKELVVEYVGSYTGPFVEDGSNEPIVKGLALLVTNNSEQMLQVAMITMKVNEAERAEFNISNLPAGASTLVLEKNKMLYSPDAKYQVEKIATGYEKNPVLHEKEFEIVGENGKLKLKNLTDKTYKKVYVYYKYLQLGGAYYGGITFRTPFENIGPNENLEEIAGHFSEGGSRITMVEIVE